MKIRVLDGLPYVTAAVTFRGQQLTLGKVILDTGSAGTIFPADRVADIGLLLEPDDAVHRIRGVGGSEFVFTKRVDRLALGNLEVKNFDIEVGAMDYGFDFEGIIGMDFLMQAGAVIDLARLEIHRAKKRGRRASA